VPSLVGFECLEVVNSTVRAKGNRVESACFTSRGRFLSDADERFMKVALREAKKGLGRTSPNPAVGAVVVRNGMIIARGYHKRAGSDHAEVVALKKLPVQAGPEDTLYVTLEPCNHTGKTPPCTHAILEKGIKRVIVGMDDPNPHVAGGGIAFLRGQGVYVKTGVLEKECRRLNEAFLKFVEAERPFVLAKSALTLDGWTATATGHSQWITGERSRRFVHQLRDRVDAVLVGLGTIRADNPQLTTRLHRGRGKDPLRIIVDTHLGTPLNARILNHNSPAETVIVHGDGIDPDGARPFTEKNGVSILHCTEKEGRIDLEALMTILGSMSISSLLVEGGARLMGSLVRNNLVDKYLLFFAPKVYGGGDGVPMAHGAGPKKMDDCMSLKEVRVRRFDMDFLIEGYPREAMKENNGKELGFR
jgi:diaminohydroxyphosphoribosylaminopyrimidine deaminase/5-amino-6-(5-phosphoribosylamino)uracil reductase